MREKPKACRVVGCNIKVADGDDLFCKGHRKALEGRSKPSKTKRSYKKGKASRGSKNAVQKEIDKTKPLFQRLRRAQCAGERGRDMVFCRSTGKVFHWDDGRRVHGGHLVSAFYRATMFSPENVWPQSAMSNFSMGMGHAESNYIEWFISEFGQEEYNKLKIASKRTRKYTVEELKILQYHFKLEIHKVVYDKKLTPMKSLPKLTKKGEADLKKHISHE